MKKRGVEYSGDEKKSNESSLARIIFQHQIVGRRLSRLGWLTPIPAMIIKGFWGYMLGYEYLASPRS